MKFFLPMAHEKVVSESEMRIKCEYADIMTFESCDKHILITVNKAGISTIKFCGTPDQTGTIYESIEENLAFAHRLIRGKIIQKLSVIVEQLGGHIIST